jgi:hypothetical protein
MNSRFKYSNLLELKIHMEIMHRNCAGIDVSRHSVIACRLNIDEAGVARKSVQAFEDRAADLLRLSDWLAAAGCTHVAIAMSTPHHRPVCNVLSPIFQVALVEPEYPLEVSGYLASTRRAEWLAERLQHGALWPQVNPPEERQELRELMRRRFQFVLEQAEVEGQLKGILETTDMMLSAFGLSSFAISPRAMLEALLSGTLAMERRVDAARSEAPEQAVEWQSAPEDRIYPRRRCLIAQNLSRLDALNEQIAGCSRHIEDLMIGLAASWPEQPNGSIA